MRSSCAPTPRARPARCWPWRASRTRSCVRCWRARTCGRSPTTGSSSARWRSTTTQTGCDHRMSSRVRRCDVAVGTTVVHPVTGRPFEVHFNGYTSDGNFASGWRTLRGADLETGEEVTTIDIWEFSVETLAADDIEVAGYAALGGPGAGTEYRQADQPAVADDRGYRNTIVEPSGEIQRRVLTAWEDIMRARTAEAWIWSRHEAPAGDPTYYEYDEDEVDDSDEAADAAYIHPELAERYPWLTEVVVRDFGIPVGPPAAAESTSASEAEPVHGAQAQAADSAGSQTADDGHDDTDGM